MANNQDARPFVDLQKDSEEFVGKFVNDIEDCKSLLDAQITALICDPDSIGSSVGPKQNALVEFSKAKYDIFVKMKSFMNEKEKEWQKYMSEMKKLFFENVEIFLAGTKLEIKLPASQYQSSSGPKKSPGNRKTTGVTSSIYPIINTITRNIPVLSSPLQRKEVRSTESKESFINFSHMGESMDTDESETDLNTSLSASRWKSTSEERIDLDSNAVNSLYLLPKGRNCRGKQSVLNSEYTELQQKNETGSEDSEEISEVDQKLQQKNETGSEDSEEISEVDQRSSRINSRKSIRASSRSNNAAISTKNNNNISEENEDVEETETSNNIVALKGRRGKQAAKTRANAKENKVIANKDSNNISDESEEVEETEANNNVVPVKGGRRKQAVKAKTSAKKLQPENEVISKKNSKNISDESEELEETETSNNVVPIKGGGRGKQVAKSKTNAKDATSVVPETRRGRSAAKNAVNVSDEIIKMPRKSVGRKTVNERVIEADEIIKMPRKSVGRKTVNERVIEAGTSVSPKKVTFTTEEDLSDDLDDVSVARPTKSAARRKTLFPYLEEAVSGADIIPGNSNRGRSKRKTIIGVADLTSVAPSKRLKASSSQRSNAAAQDESAADDDNLSEINDSYSEWIPLKSTDGKVPATPAIYEVKVWRAKKSAFIGSCDSLRQKLTLHKFRQNSGHKHLDKFIDRNFDDIQVRYELVSSINDAKVEVKNRINNFVAQHKTTPAYN